MKKIVFIILVLCISNSISCDDEDFEVEVCAGCEPDFPWSVPGSSECYKTFNECTNSERGECAICS